MRLEGLSFAESKPPVTRKKINWALFSGLF